MRHRKSRRYNKFRSNGRNYQSRSNGNEQTRMGAASFSNGRGRNNFKSHHNPKQLVDKYNSLAKEALSSGDQILSENYYQHADHFLRISQVQRVSKIESKKESNELITKKISANNVPGSDNKSIEPEAKLPKDI